MAIYRCSICGYEYDEEKEGLPFSELNENWKCPICKRDKEAFKSTEKVDNGRSRGYDRGELL